MNKALIVGIDSYKAPNNLKGCVNDASAVYTLLKANYDASRNFDCKLLLNEDATKTNLVKNLKSTFKDDEIDIGLFYFSGHGYDDEADGGVVCLDKEQNLIRFPFPEIMQIVNNAKCKSKIVILDCCYSGKCGIDTSIGDQTILGRNTVILTACSNKEAAWEKQGHGVFTTLLLSGLNGGASDILGDITPGSLYAYIDKALNAWEQRPFFKANVSSFCSLRKCKPAITKEQLYKLCSLFEEEDYQYPLDPSYEFTNDRKTNKKAIRPYAIKKNCETFKLLQLFSRNGIVVPVDEEFMYFAAINNKSCELSSIGKHYWRLCKENKI